MYSRVTLLSLEPFSPGGLPAALVGLDNATLADLPAALDPVPAEFDGVGYWPAAIIYPPIDGRLQTITPGFDLAVDANAKTVTATARIRDLTADEIAALPPLPARTVSAVQAKTALHNAGIYGAAEAAVASHPYELFRIWWASAQAWREDHPYVAGVAAELGLTDEQVADLFTAAERVVT